MSKRDNRLRELLINGLNGVYDLAEKAEKYGYSVGVTRCSMPTSTVTKDDGTKTRGDVTLHGFILTGGPA